MKIVYVYDSIARIGGMERILTDKMNYLAEIYGHEVYLITSSQGNHPLSFPLSDKVEHIDLDTKFHLQYQHPLLEQLKVGWTLNHKFEQKLKKEIKLINPDIISGNTSFKADLICKLNCKAKKIIESHCAKIYTRIPANRKKSFFKDIKDRYVSYQCFRDVKRYSDAIVTLTQGDAAMWGQHPYKILHQIYPVSSRGGVSARYSMRQSVCRILFARSVCLPLLHGEPHRS